MTMSESNKAVVRRFNLEVIAAGDRAAFEALVAPDFINHSAPPEASSDREGLWATFHNLLRPAFSSLQVAIEEQVAERDLVTTRKTISGIHTGALLEIAPTGLPVTIQVIDMVQIANGRYVAHWGMNSLAAVVARLRAASLRT